MLTGRTAAEIRTSTLTESRRKIESSRRGEGMSIVSRFPFIGRGNIMRDRLLSHEQVERSLSEALR
jgi:hypothetical protein